MKKLFQKPLVFITLLFSFINNCEAQIIATKAGTGVPGYSGDGNLATIAQLDGTFGVAIDIYGNTYIADFNNSRIRKVNTNGIITTIAGTGVAGFSGDGGPANVATLNGACGLAVDISGNVYIGEYYNRRIRKVNTSGIISTFAGTGGLTGFSGDGGLATNAEIWQPFGITVDGAGNVYFTNGNSIRKINTSGIITTIAGTVVAGFSGDGGAANLAELAYARGVVIDAFNNLYIADTDNHRIRKINSTGIITTISGTGTYGSSGDGGPANVAEISDAESIAVDLSGNIYFTEYLSRVRVICVNSCITNIKSLKVNNNNILVYPNPNNGSFTLQNEKKSANSEIILVNSLGQVVHQQKIIFGKNEIKTLALPIGLYNLVLIQDNQEINYSKVSVE